MKIKEMELCDICFENIKDTFYYGLFGDFKLVIDKSTGYFNATKLCERGGKNFFDWKRLEKSKSMVEYYQKSWPGNSQASFLYQVKLQNNDRLNKRITGTYVPKELILDIASWVSIEFYDKCNRIVVDYFVEETRRKIEHLQIELQAKETELQVKDEQHKAELQVKDEQHRAENLANEEHILLLKDMLIDDQKRDKTQVIYIATSQNYARQNRFKIGGVESTDKLASRFSTYNSRSAAGDEWYYSDTFLIADYRQIESRLKDLVGRFRDKKSKEIYVMHYTNIKYIVDYLCRHYCDEVDEVNAKLTEFISNLNRHHLRPIVPPPSEVTYASITTLAKDGRATNTTLEAGSPSDFVAVLREYIANLDESITCITKKQVFDDLRVTKDRREKTSVVKAVFEEMRPDVNLKSKS
jgi:hypothetical protein